MPRKPRLFVPGVPQHVVQRGNNRQQTFFDESDFRLYLDCLRLAGEEFGVSVHAYVLMTNHVHLLATPDSAEALSRTMQSVGRQYVLKINRKHRRSGTLWEGRFKAGLVGSERYLLTCYRYIELNPVRARMVVAPGEYPWSSYASNAFGAFDDLVVPHERYLSLASTPERRQEKYRELFSAAIPGGDLNLLRRATEQSAVAGTEDFQRRMADRVGRTVAPRSPGRPARK